MWEAVHTPRYTVVVQIWQQNKVCECWKEEACGLTAKMWTTMKCDKRLGSKEEYS